MNKSYYKLIGIYKSIKTIDKYIEDKDNTKSENNNVIKVDQNTSIYDFVDYFEIQ